MAKKKSRVDTSGGGEINMTPMIDVVFQMIIFFVCTVELDRKQFDENIRLAMSPHGPAVEKKDPRTVVVEVDRRGRISISRRYMSLSTLQAILTKARAEYGGTLPLVIRGDQFTRHDDVRRVMDAAKAAGLWKVRFATVKDRAGTAR